MDIDGTLEAGFEMDLSSDEYLRQRIQPKLGDPFYLCLSDLLLALEGLIPKSAARVLGYLCRHCLVGVQNWLVNEHGRVVWACLYLCLRTVERPLHFAWGKNAPLRADGLFQSP